MRINIEKHLFDKGSYRIMESNSFSVDLFQYPSGVEAIKLTNSKGYIVVLPFKGQQIWDAQFNGHDLGMISNVKEPVQSNDYLENFGCFLLHCGASRVGAPTEKHPHPLHGDLPNAVYNSAYIECSRDDKGEYLSIGGTYHYNSFFGNSYIARPEVKLYCDTTTLDVTISIENTSHTTMELMYLCHINFRPQNNATLHYSADYNSNSIRLRKSIPSHITVSDDFKKSLDIITNNVITHHKLDGKISFDPEQVFFIDYKSDKQGWAHSLLELSSGEAYYVAHKPEQLPRANRWVSRTTNHDAIAIAEPATCEVEGFEMEKLKGNIQQLEPGKIFIANMVVGLLNKEQTKNIINSLNQ